MTKEISKPRYITPTGNDQVHYQSLMKTIAESPSFSPNETYDYQHLKRTLTKDIQSRIVTSGCHHLYFTTTRLKRIKIDEAGFHLEMKQEYPFLSSGTWSTYSLFYRHLISNLMNHFNHKTYLHPLTFDFLDVDGTDKSIKSSFSRYTIPHIHSIYLLHEKTLPKFIKLMEEQFIPIVLHKDIHPYISRFHAEPITTELSKVVSYASKFYDNVEARRIRYQHQLYNCFPIADFEKTELAQKRREMDFYQFVQSNREMRKRFHS